MKINYVIATWTGPRRRGNDPHKEDKAYYIKEHLRLLTKYKHSLSQITLVAPVCDKEPAETTAYIEQLNNTVQENVPIAVLRRENYGQSYGSYSHAYGLTRNAFDYYIFTEDDYVFVQDNFDQKLIDIYNSKPNCGYLCGLAAPFPKKLHAAISNGIASKETLEKIWQTYGKLPHGNMHASYAANYHCQPQLQFSWAFLDVGLELRDFTNKYNVIFNEIGKCIVFGNNKEHLMLPLQFKSKFKELA